MFAAVTLAVWAEHRRALRAGGYRFSRFCGRGMEPDAIRLANHGDKIVSLG